MIFICFSNLIYKFSPTSNLLFHSCYLRTVFFIKTWLRRSYCNAKDLEQHNFTENRWWNVTMKVGMCKNVVTFITYLSWYFTINHSDIEIKKVSLRFRMFQFYDQFVAIYFFAWLLKFHYIVKGIKIISISESSLDLV